MEPGSAPGGPGGPPPVPQWVKLLGVAALLAIVGFVALHLSGQSPTGH